MAYAAPSTPKFVYFNLRGLGEAIRCILHDAGVAYEEVNGSDGWAARKGAGMADGTIPFGQMPLLVTETGAHIVQSGAIVRHLARTLNLYGATPADATTVDMALEGLADWRRAYSKLVYEQQLDAAALAAYAAALPDRESRGGYLGHMEAFAAAHGGPFLTGPVITVADLVAWDLIDTHHRVMPALLAGCPALTAWFARVSARPGLKAYVDSDPEHRRAANGNKLG